MGRVIALKHEVPLKLDIHSIGGPSNRQFELHNYNIKADLATRQEADLLRWKKRPFVRRMIRKLLHYPDSLLINAPTYIKENQEIYNEDIEYIGKDVYLDGYWQKDNYFFSISNIIQNDLTLKEEVLSDIAIKFARNIKQDNSVSIHFRRGDYINNPDFFIQYCHCSFEYYTQAAKYILKKNPDAHFYVFSDEPDWVRNNYNLEIPMTVIPEGNASYVDLWLMSLCKHNIIANSSFSWWAALLNQNTFKIVIYPKAWFKNHKTPVFHDKSWLSL